MNVLLRSLDDEDNSSGGRQYKKGEPAVGRIGSFLYPRIVWCDSYRGLSTINCCDKVTKASDNEYLI